MDIIVVSVFIDVFFSSLVRRSRKVRISNFSIALGILCGISLWVSKRVEVLAISFNFWAKFIIGKIVLKSKRRFSVVFILLTSRSRVLVVVIILKFFRV